MITSAFQSVTFIGAGGVAWSLAQALSEITHISQIYSRTLSHAMDLADLTGAEAVNRPELVRSNASLYIVALADHAVNSIIPQLTPAPDAVWVTTSGTLLPESLASMSPYRGVFYPLQTFTRGTRVPMTDVPVFVEGSFPETTAQLMDLAGMISRSVFEADAKTRMKLHIAGVISCNFVNHLWDTAARLLKAEGLSIDLVRPLIAQSLDKISRMSPHEAQTGPARRGDIAVMREHMRSLDDDDALMYRLLSDRILKLYHSTDEQNKL